MQVSGGKRSTNSEQPSSGDAYYVHDQNTASSLWIINHELHKYASVTVVDSSKRVVIGSINYNSPDELTVEFSAPFSGTAYLN